MGMFAKCSMRTVLFSTLSVCLAVLAACTPAGPKSGDESIPVATQPGTTGQGEEIIVSGLVKLDGPRPERKPLDTGADKDCKAMHAEEPLLSDTEIVNEDGGVQFAFVYVKNPPKGDYPVPSEPAVMDQQGCRYVPHVLAMRAGQQLDTKNSDAVTHNVRSYTDRNLNRPWNFGQQGVGVRSRKIEKPEMAIKLKCDYHPWMTGWIHVMDHPFYCVTDANGRFDIKGLPAGEYTLVAWHEVYGEIEQPLKVEKSVADVSFRFTHKK